MASAKMKPPFFGFCILLWLLNLVSVVYAQLNLGQGIQQEVFFLNLEDGYFGCQVNESTQVLQLFELSKLCDGTANCYFGSDENMQELKCINTCPYTQGHSCINGACLDGLCHCNDGYGGCGCEDLDENECKYRPCDVFASCTNTLGSFFCSCYAGYEGDGHSCKDIDECLDPKVADQCVDNAWCCNLPAHYTCKCNDGFEGDGYKQCIDINECTKLTACGHDAICNNLPGNHTCTCPEGYIGNPYDGCVDVDECLRENVCGPEAKCSNREGGHTCDCPIGYRGNPYSRSGCLDVNECADSPCSKGAVCHNGINNFTCSCPAGFQGDPYNRNGQCQDINECYSNPCGINAKCLDNIGSYGCQCLDGYMGDPHRECTDIDECSSLIHPCGLNAICHNVVPGHECSCPNGFSPNPTALDGCEQIEVEVDCKSNFDCVNNAICNQHRCSCREGFSTVRASCIDLNECLQFPCGSNANCQNIPGSYQCFCKIGYIGNPPIESCKAPCEGIDCGSHATCQAQGKDSVCLCNKGWSYNQMDISAGCVDINECDLNHGPSGLCGQGSICTNLEGSFSCACPSGFYGNSNILCQDIDECKNIGACGIGATCSNSVGSFACQCPPGTMAEPDPFTECLEIMSCEDEGDCPGNAMCLGSQCMCPDPNIGDDCRHPCEDVRCSNNAECKLINGVAKCLCLYGYNGNALSTRGCTDINECNNKPCGPGAICNNELGSFSCECPRGFEGNAAREGCTEGPDPECTSSSPCPSGEQCVLDVNTGHNVCVCQRGFTRDEKSKECRDVNECIEQRACGSNAICKNIPSSYDCQCPPDYVGNPFDICQKCSTIACQCQPPNKFIDEKCVSHNWNCSKEKPCHGGAECISVQGGHSYCVCPSGYTTLKDGSCEDINECLDRQADGTLPCGINSECQNEIGSYKCMCLPGSTGDPYENGCTINHLRCGYDRDCRDNEQCLQPGICVCPPPYYVDNLDDNRCKSPCEAFTCGINSKCTPTDPPKCKCLPGFISSGLGGCVDIDECRNSPCGVNAICLNEIGGFKCQCPPNSNGDPYIESCIVEGRNQSHCLSDNDCVNEYKCKGGECINPCTNLPCGRNAYCVSDSHSRFCRCLPGNVEGHNGECISICDGFLCGSNAECIVTDEGPTCKCRDAFIGNPFPGGDCSTGMCSAGNHCTEPQICVNGRCKERCEGIICGLNAKCDKITNKCICLPYFLGDPTLLCVAPGTPPLCTPPCGLKAHCEYGLPNRCICDKMSSGNPYESCVFQKETADCSTTICGKNAKCRQGVNRVDCACPNGYRGNPYIECTDVNECIGNGSCGMNAICFNTPGSFDCRCQDGFLGNPFMMCMPPQKNPCDENPDICDCTSDSDCISDFICKNNKCQDKCDQISCAANAGCLDGSCKCSPGYTGEPASGCLPPLTCRNNFDCEDDEICFSRRGQRTCVKACEKAACGTNSICLSQNHRSSCLCKDGFVPIDNDRSGSCHIMPGSNCEYNRDCTNNFVCQLDRLGVRYCIDPCLNLVCDQNELCFVEEGQASCKCDAGYIRHPFSNDCQKPSIPDCENDQECSADSACMLDNLSVMKCIDTCKDFTCGLHSFCVSINHKGQCKCKEGFTGNPNDRSGCRPVSQDHCKTDAQCHENEICQQKGDRKICIPVCNGYKCGPGAVCVAKNHAGQCQCPPGKFTGDPSDLLIGCSSVSCLINEDCDQDKICNRLNFQCFDACYDACGENAICIPENHRYNCICPPGSKPSPSAEILCSTIDACNLNPCHHTASCIQSGDNYQCKCLNKWIGDPYVDGCHPEGMCPNGDEDCQHDSICINERCSSPCEKACGPNSKCSVSNKKPICTCPVGLEPIETPERGCTRTIVGCSSDAQCQSGICNNEKCHSVCRNNNGCLQNEKCISNICQILCITTNQCPNNHACIAGVCVIGCRSNSECPQQEACINNKCIDPCSRPGACGPNSICKSDGHVARCECPIGFKATITAQHGCIRIPSICNNDQDCLSNLHCENNICISPCTINSQCAQGESCNGGKCLKVCFSNGNCLQGEVCLGTSCIVGCNTKSDCLPNEICMSNKCLCARGYVNSPSGCADIDECVEDPCNHHSEECINVPGSFICSCPKETVRDLTSLACMPPNECSTDNDCAGNNVCKRNRNGNTKCVDPCGSTVCGKNSQCILEDRKPLCTCRSGFYGNPNNVAVGCVQGECIINSDCQSNRACNQVSYKCKDPCDSLDCRYGRCQTINHIAACFCEKGFQVLSSTGSCIDINECLDNPCHKTAECKNTVGGFTCHCPGKEVGDPYNNGCREPGTCTSHHECPRLASCINGKCKNPCETISCGIKAKCRPINRQAVCFCPPLTTGKPDIECTEIECDSSISFCKPGFTCLSNKCVGICDIVGTCGKNANCHYQGSSQICSCKAGFTGDAKLGCTHIISCTSESECPSGEQCNGGICVSTCTSNRECLNDQVCITGSCIPTCRNDDKCPHWQVCQNAICVPELKCLRNGDCNTSEMCSKNAVGQAKCTNVCDGLTLCGRNAICVSRKHEAVCQCPEDYYGDPMDERIGCKEIQCSENNECKSEEICKDHQCRVACRIENNCGSNAVCTSENHNAVCFCLKGYEGDPLGGCTPIDFCKNYPCASDAKCVNYLGSFKCSCPIGTVGEPFKVGCKPPPDCVTNDDCPVFAYCNEKDEQKCVPSCDDKICGNNAECNAINHEAICQCINGYEGDANKGCRPTIVLCKINSDCPPNTICEGKRCRPPCQNNDHCDLDEACKNGQCTDQCSEGSFTCGLNAECKIINHMKKCSCPVGFTGDVEIECYRIPGPCQESNDCQTGFTCESGVCALICSRDNNCAQNEKCVQGICLMTCRVDNDCFLGHICLKNICMIGCRVNEDCSATESCVNSKCTDSCKLNTLCGPNANCNTLNHRVQCSCPTGFIPNPTPNIACVRKPIVCELNTDCQKGYVCNVKLCTPICSSKINCLRNEQCNNNMCTPVCGNDDDCRSGAICQNSICVAGCRSNQECPSTTACINYKCVNLCDSSRVCGVNSKCSIENQQIKCECLPGMIGNPEASCRLPSITCKANADCDISMQCIAETCKPKCSNDQACLDNERCIGGVCKEICSSHFQCSNGFICLGRVCVAGCRSDTTCPSNQSCINKKCRDPCENGRACGECTQCKVINHRTQCNCLSNTLGNPSISCSVLHPSCKNDKCSSNEICEGGHCFNICSDQSDCSCGEVCSKKLCRPKCDTKNKCNQGLLCESGSCVAGCRSNTDCPTTSACVNNQCKNTCDTNPCGINANCKSSDHRALCICQNGYHGDAYIECKEYECEINSDCSEDKACIKKDCRDLCLLGKCGENANCKTVHHEAQCTCPYNYYGNPTDVCHEDINECLKNPCPHNTNCINTFGNYTCECKPRCLGDPYNIAGCMCTHTHVSCASINCGLNAECQKNNLDGIECVCPSKYPNGNPLTECIGPDCRQTNCGNDARCQKGDDDKYQCVCRDGWTGNAYVKCQLQGKKIVCRHNEDCSSNQACIENDCVNPCAVDKPCPPTKQCSVLNHQPVCICLEDCHPSVSICLNDRGCPSSQACMHYQCTDPCVTHVCSKPDLCYVEDHKPKCKFCPHGFTINENFGCVPAIGCKDNSNCPVKLACINDQCQNPCIANNPCNSNEDCKIEGQIAQCVTVGCRSNAECLLQEACINEHCVSPCVHNKPCVDSEDCEVRDHVAFCSSVCTCNSDNKCPREYSCDGCTCRKDYEPICTPHCRDDETCDANRLVCIPAPTPPSKNTTTGCLNNFECLDSEQCISRKCQNPCFISSHCGPNAECITKGHATSCVCPSAYKGNPYALCIRVSIAPEDCSSDIDCPLKEVCYDQNCKNPCDIANPCGVNAKCYAKNHRPTCECISGFRGDPKTLCNDDNIIINGCRANTDCLDTQACINNICKHPCDVNSCGSNADCINSNYQATCRCRNGFKGDTRNGCIPVSTVGPKCYSNRDCPSNRMCDALSQYCLDPCTISPCVTSAKCFVLHHEVNCECPSGYSGNPFIECVIQSSGTCEPECPDQLACINAKCIDPCNCGTDALCEVFNHRATCRCPQHYQGNPLESCHKTVFVDNCDLNVCGENAMCELEHNNPICFCPKGTTGNPFEKCIPDGDPCENNPCGPNSGCRISAGSAVCFCLPEYFGNPPRESCKKRSNPCDVSPCGENTNCNIVNGYHRCTCKDSFIGNPNTIRGCDERINPCDPNVCGENALCNPSGFPLCLCRPGLIGDPYTSCKEPEVACQGGSCGLNAECYINDNIINCRCLEGYDGNPHVRCLAEDNNPCEPNPCGSNAQCRIHSNTAICKCLPLFYGNPSERYGCQPQCSNSANCTSEQYCLNTQCIDACVGICGINAHCVVESHRPVCSCPTGYYGSPHKYCKIREIPIANKTKPNLNPCSSSPCGEGAHCQVINSEIECVCFNGYLGNPYDGCIPECLINNDCRNNKACFNNKCIDPCPGKCGQDALCEVDNHNPICYCPEELTGNPFVHCAQRPIIVQPKDKLCDPDPCGKNEICSRTADGYICSCRSEYFGSPCRPECTASSDCPANNFCKHNKCIDPCPGTCGVNSLCTVISHLPVCSCRNGYTGDPFTLCYIDPGIEISTVCNPPCGSNEVCEIKNGFSSCGCRSGFFSRPEYTCGPECTTNNHCKTHEACLNQQCTNPCESACGRKSECTVYNHRPVCSCLPNHGGDPYVSCEPIEVIGPGVILPVAPCHPDPCGSNTKCTPIGTFALCTCIPDYIGDPNIQCGPQCVTSSDCLKTQSCIGKKCSDPCPGSCGRNAQCIVISHKPICSCPTGYIGDPFTLCIKKPIISDDPCRVCGPNTECRKDINDNIECSCKGVTRGDPFSNRGCRPECVSNIDCRPSMACRNYKCQDPCKDTCGINAECFVVVHNPSCYCPKGLSGDASRICTIIPITGRPNTCNSQSCGTNALCTIVNDISECNCLPGYYGNPIYNCRQQCQIDSECSSIMRCNAGKCINPCLGQCGENSECIVVNHKPICSCRNGYQGDPYKKCHVTNVIEITSPCNPSPCGPNSKCEINTYRPVCSCLPGYFNEPPQCGPRCINNQDCKRELACINNDCRDPCIGTCGTNALCKIVNHKPICYCPASLIGDPYISCKIDTDPPIIKPVSPCLGNPCGQNAICKEFNGQPTCSCLSGFLGSPPFCRYECVIHSECPSNEACINNQCKNPCPGVCGINAICTVNNHNPICSCVALFTGDPFIRCTPLPIVIEPTTSTPPKPISTYAPVYPPIIDTTPIINEKIFPEKFTTDSTVGPIYVETKETKIIDSDPCDVNPCGPNAICQNSNHDFICNCKANYFGDAYIGCRPECILNSDCGQQQKCYNTKCVNACLGRCAATAECRVINHRDRCFCPPTMTGNPEEECSYIPIIKEPPITTIKPTVSAPCANDPCGINAVCSPNGIYADCRCKPDFFGNPYEHCKPECEKTSECPFYLVCDKQKCVDPCPSTCGMNALCKVVVHNILCECKAGYTGDPYTACTIYVPPPQNVCEPSPCGPNSYCNEVNGRPVCTCQPGFFNKPPNCRPACLYNNDCTNVLSCINNKCQDPCPGICGNNAICDVYNHRPICSCPEGMTGDPNIRCRIIRDGQPCKCGLNAECSKEDTTSCKCLKNYYGDPYKQCQPECTIDSDCVKSLSCYNLKCIDPCPGTCGIRAVCDVINHKPFCQCPTDKTGDPLVECVVTPLKPPSVCNPNRCGPYTQCRVDNNGQRECQCLSGYQGSPQKGCSPHCTINSNCPLSTACINRLCIDPCIGACHPTAECLVFSHHPQCSCPAGFTGNPTYGCQPAIEADRCLQCGNNAECLVNGEFVTCKCPPNYIGNPYVNCKPECVINEDCPKYLACSNQKCTNPCRDVCGTNALCDVIDHRPKCSCTFGHIGDPYIECRQPINIEPECRTSSQCSNSLACIEERCQDPCAVYGNCAPNANCYVRNHHPICTCPIGYSGNPGIQCIIVGCRDNSQCPVQKACINKYCEDPCLYESCGINALCKIEKQKAKCYCPERFKGDPYIICKRPDCEFDRECPGYLACIKQECRNPCNCGNNADCRVINHRPRCSCYAGYTGDPQTGCLIVPVIESPKECTIDGDCQSKLACLDEKCQDPCLIIRPCRVNALCDVLNTLPYRTMTCVCSPGYERDANEDCKLKQPIPIGCTADDHCGLSEICRNHQCIDPCIVLNPCAENAECKVDGTAPQCSCPSGYHGDPRINCYTITTVSRECTVDADCRKTEACYNEKCADPCIVENPCGRGAVCKPQNHRPLCYCPDNWFGNPTIQCFRAACVVNQDCPNDKACEDQNCVDPCSYRGSPCAITAKCRGILHEAQCYCPRGTQGHPTVSCVSVGCFSNADCSDHQECDQSNSRCIDVCSTITCANNAICTAINHVADCDCLQGHFGNPFIQCAIVKGPSTPSPIPQCRHDSDCFATQACLNELCTDPCAIASPCIPSQDCRVVASEPLRTMVCECPKDEILFTDGICIPLISKLPECILDSDCNDFEHCKERICVHVCRNGPCGLNAICTGYEHREQCICAPTFYGDPKIECSRTPIVVRPHPECTIDDHCSAEESCVNERCVNPCLVGDPCARYAFCSVSEHRPVCRCPEGYTGDPEKQCRPIDAVIPLGCRADNECPGGEACINTKCIIPCNCGPNAECRVTDHRPICTCMIGFQGDPITGCYKSGCMVNEECPTDKMCYSGVCINPCSIHDPCAINAECYPEHHEEKCRCRSGMIGDPYIKCLLAGCQNNDECPSDNMCENRKCIDPCLYENMCAPNANCFVVRHTSGCKCPPDLPFGDPRVLCLPMSIVSFNESECIVDRDCPSQNACIDKKCVNPCLKLKPCDVTARCEVLDTIPVRTMKCICIEGYVMSENDICKEVEIIITPKCITDSECGTSEACVNEMCKDPCHCGLNAECDIVNHRTVCTCQVGFQGAPDIGCFKVGCEFNSECEDDKACIENVCVNPCLVNDPCASNAECFAVSHKANCRCPSGLIADGFSKCIIIGCRTDTQCPNAKACVNNKCIDPCTEEDVCLITADCLSVDHQAKCRCPTGTFGDPRIQCDIIPSEECYDDADCSKQRACLNNRCVNPCIALDPCHDTAICKVIDTLPLRTMLCVCIDGEVVEENGGCALLPPIRPQCTAHENCPVKEACINSFCKDPCQCGRAADCAIFDHHPVCTCKPGYEGDPEIACFEISCHGNNDCEMSHACMDGQCAPVCGINNAPCGTKSICQGINHEPKCYCPPGLRGNPNTQCIAIGCKTDDNCPGKLACINDRCEDPCSINPCIDEATCRVENHIAVCICPPGLNGTLDRGCEGIIIGCRMDAECPSKLACLNGKCKNICKLDPCGTNADCRLVNTLPMRIAACECIPGYQGDASIICHPVPVCPLEKGFIIEDGVCICPSKEGFYVDEFGKCLHCPSERGFVISGDDRCICDPVKGYVLDKEGNCNCPLPLERTNNGDCVLVELPTPIPICTVNQECSYDRMCRNQKCVKPCGFDPCAKHATCINANHTAVCDCLKGYQGNPYQEDGCDSTPIAGRTDFPRPNIAVNCLADGVQVLINIGNPVFNGVMYVKGYSKNIECSRGLRQGIDESTVDFKVKFNTCGLVHENGLAKFVLVIQKHPKLVTYEAQAYHVKCTYSTGEKTISLGFNVSMLTTAGTIVNTGPPPVCVMEITSQNGKSINEAEIGDLLMLKVKVEPSNIYGGFARSCIALTSNEDGPNNYKVTDENGCATDPVIFQEWKLDDEKSLVAPFSAFKFPSSDSIRFQCNVRVCFGRCQPVNCQGYDAYGKRRKRRQAINPDAESIYEDEATYEGQMREIKVSSQAILTVERRSARLTADEDPRSGLDEVCVSKWGFIIALIITALLALVAVAVAVSCWLMAYRRRPKHTGPLPHPENFPNPLFTTPEPLAEPSPDYLS